MPVWIIYKKEEMVAETIPGISVTRTLRKFYSRLARDFEEEYEV